MVSGSLPLEPLHSATALTKPVSAINTLASSKPRLGANTSSQLVIVAHCPPHGTHT